VNVHYKHVIFVVARTARIDHVVKLLIPKLLMQAKNWDSKITAHINKHVLSRHVSTHTSATQLYTMLDTINLRQVFGVVTTDEQKRTFVYRSLWKIFARETAVSLARKNVINNTRFPDGKPPPTRPNTSSSPLHAPTHAHLRGHIAHPRE
jgi:hypothetical protein